MGSRAALRHPAAGTAAFPLAGACRPPRRGCAGPWPAPCLAGASSPSPRPAPGHLHRGARRRGAGGRARPGRRRARALTARPRSLTRSSPASEHSMAVKVTPTLRCCLDCISDILGIPLADPPASRFPLGLGFRSRVLGLPLAGGELCGARTGGRGCPAGGGEGGRVLSWGG